ncbi:hypothetical protein BY996DRAFT_6504236 [Phakopsora pachyrhizi]|uniref:Uncharacterized protein n=1 Tax=Phakopsora pachyrhizi TaxID=170000 RepID=A0AAV0AX59_PHAPC|nr:hypothetical protein BY996DRAFT_6504236 [Phakopsora pachyrhizi]CAH7673413.1 hypothetical protein PPACK8108_LOCUS8267 [Phakopsora pachyrhizi]
MPEKQLKTIEVNSDNSGDESKDKNNKDDSSQKKLSAYKKKLNANKARLIQVSINHNPEQNRPNQLASSPNFYYLWPSKSPSYPPAWFIHPLSTVFELFEEF